MLRSELRLDRRQRRAMGHRNRVYTATLTFLTATLVVGAVTSPAAHATVNPNTFAPTTRRHDCGNHISAVSVVPHAGFNPLTATAAQLIANHLPTRPSGAKNLAIWKHYVTTPKPSAPSCAVRAGHRNTGLESAQRHRPTGMVRPDGAQSNEHSANWAGNVVDDETYTDAYTYFNVPRAEGTASADYYKSFWDGVGQGDSSSQPMAQGGVEADFTGDAAHYYLWWQFVPQMASQNVISYDVGYGDLIYVHSHLSQNDDWIYIINETRGYSGTYSYNTSGFGPDGTAEWILERTQEGNDFPRLSTGAGTFNSADVKATSLAYTAITSLPHYYDSMWNCTNGPDEELAYPGSINSSGGYTVYTDHYGSPTARPSCSVW